MQRKHVYFAGRVQGVGFRYTTRNIAENYEMVGFVRNMPDGRVEVVIEGEETQLTAFLDELNRQMSRYITEISLQDEPCQDEFNGFEIRF